MPGYHNEKVPHSKYLAVLKESEAGAVHYVDLAEFFSVSEGTARRHLDFLVESGDVVKTRPGFYGLKERNPNA